MAAHGDQQKRATSNEDLSRPDRHSQRGEVGSREGAVELMGRAKLGYTRVGRVGYVYNQVWKEEKRRSPVAVWEGSFVTKANWRQVR